MAIFNDLAIPGFAPTDGAVFAFGARTGGYKETALIDDLRIVAVDTATAPAITTPPQSQTVTAGANVTFTVVATGTAPLTYQWRKDNANIPGATSASYTITGAQASAAGSYNVVVSNGAGSTPSAAATLVVNPVVVAPAITTPPQSQTVTAGANVTFTVVATGTAPLTYQWRKDNANIPGATSASYTITGAQASAAGSYNVVVSNGAGSTPSAAATLVVNPVVVAPAITTPPQSQTVTAGANVTFTVVATGTAPLTYQWRKDNANIPGATSASYTITGAQASAAGSYNVVVSNGAGSTPSAAATLVVNPVVVAPAITTPPQSQTVTAGANVTFTVVATGTAPLTYQWRKDNANIPGATSASYTITGAQASAAGSYNVVVSNGAGSTPSAAATLVVVVPPDYSQNFDAFADGTVALGDGSRFITDTPSAAGVYGHALQLTKDGVGATHTFFLTPSLPGVKAKGGFEASFKYRLATVAANVADGFSFNYGPITAGMTGTREGFAAEEGWGVGLSVGFDTWGNGGTDVVGHNVSVNGVDVPGGTKAKSNLADGIWHSVVIKWNATTVGNGQFSMTTDGQAVFANLATPGFTPADGAVVAFGARTGGYMETALIDDLRIVSVEASAAPRLGISRNADGSFQLVWTNGGTLEVANDVTGPYTSTGDATGSRRITVPAGTPDQYWRVKR